MKLLFVLTLFPLLSYSQTIEEINTKQDVEQYIVREFKYYDFEYDSFKIFNADPKYDILKKVDLNKDGNEDILVFGTAYFKTKNSSYDEDEIVIILGNRHKIKKVQFPYYYFRRLASRIIAYPKVIESKKGSIILIQYTKMDKPNGKQLTYYDTLTIENDHIIPYTINPSEKILAQIDFKTDYCYGTCPVFELSINSDLKTYYNGIDHVDKKGEFNLLADRDDWNYLSNLIRNLNVNKLSDSYFVNWTDDQTAYLTLYFQDGSKKEIEDYGLSGTFGLSILYEYLFELRKF